MKTWNIYLIDDGLEENHETFTVTLKTPKNAVLGQRMSASVEIIDPRGGKKKCHLCDVRHVSVCIQSVLLTFGSGWVECIYVHVLCSV